MMKTTLIILGIIAAAFITGCSAQVNNNNEANINTTNMNSTVTINQPNTIIQPEDSSTYIYCLENNGIILSTNPNQCLHDGVVYYQYTGNAIQLRSCTSYYDGCNICVVNNGTIGVCTKRACSEENMKTPRCLNYDETQSPSSYVNTNFTCDEGNITISFDNIAHTANLAMNKEITLLAQIITGSGAAYSDQHMTFFNHGNEATIYDAINSSKIIMSNCVAQ